jgi:hypothetical protein
MIPFVGQHRVLSHSDGTITPITVASVEPANNGGDCYNVTDTHGRHFLFATPSEQQVENSLRKAA